MAKIKDEFTKECGHRSILKQFILGILANFSSVGPSMSLGFSAVALPVLHGQLNTIELSWFASIASLATPFGCFFAGPFADRYGRRMALFFVNIVCLLGWITIAVFCYAKPSHFWILLLGRVLTGLSTGLCSSPATVYMAEISSPDLRGIFTTWASVSFSLGVLVVYFLGFLFQSNLGAICLITAVFPCVGILFSIFLIPESPTWLVGRYRTEEARSSLCRIFNTGLTPDVQAELDHLIKCKGVSNMKSEKPMYRKILSKLEYLMQPHCLRPMILVLTYFFFQQFSGIFVIIFYAIDIVNNAGITFDPYITIVVIGVVRLISAILPSFLAKRFGRRPLSLFSGLGIASCLLPLALYIKLKDNGSLSGYSLTFLPLICLLVYFVTNSIGFLPLPFALAAELFPTKVRGTAAGIISGMGYFFNFIAVKIYPDMVQSLGRSGVFCFYGVIALLGTIFVFFLLPETKGKSLQEIEEYFGKKKVSISEETKILQEMA
ncbi:facilitated trehalose transporter Tret1-like isoform X1 [Diabrotica virgifera virgifera]|uniref:Major facilitator superfamily (MFS) profile domain-containing protein n=1 Tax=Diabrotica virgifera virgifera TaxID=50390 RepID=A0ABM5JXI5_DIAVI|nr:facilitated trehalose transporter Tret1-like isoform X1 [Diabrotica virgifera virgifera]XP_050502653.1 facilitated trehalose transporter Tret1-like isoform X1 [Diabrotica virgifera virgifera]